MNDSKSTHSMSGICWWNRSNQLHWEKANKTETVPSHHHIVGRRTACTNSSRAPNWRAILEDASTRVSFRERVLPRRARTRSEFWSRAWPTRSSYQSLQTRAKDECPEGAPKRGLRFWATSSPSNPSKTSPFRKPVPWTETFLPEGDGPLRASGKTAHSPFPELSRTNLEKWSKLFISAEV